MRGNLDSYCKNHNRVWNVLEQLTNRNVPVKIFSCSVNIKTKDCAPLRPFQHKLQHHCSHGKASKPQVGYSGINVTGVSDVFFWV